MTPLAIKLFRGLLEERDRPPVDDRGVLVRLKHPRFFEMTAASAIAEAVWHCDTGALERTFILPADETWIEWHVGGFRSGVMLLRQPNGWCDIYRITPEGVGRIGRYDLEGIGWEVGPDDLAEDDEDAAAWWRAIATYLAVINTPKLVARREHPPHRGLARSLRRNPAPAPYLSPQPWTEVLLEIMPSSNLAGGTVGSRLTGKKCLHFCRSHLRVQGGRLVVVSPHWRGDRALGVKHSDYRALA